MWTRDTFATCCMNVACLCFSVVHGIATFCPSNISLAFLWLLWTSFLAHASASKGTESLQAVSQACLGVHLGEVRTEQGRPHCSLEFCLL